MKKFFNENKKMIWIVGTLIILTIIFGLAVYSYRENKKYRIAKENEYNKAFYELVDNVQNVETYLAKSMISSTPEHGAETLTNLWREANLAQSYLSMLPIESQELENTEKFLNQVSDYSYTLSRKNIYKEGLSTEDLGNLIKNGRISKINGLLANILNVKLIMKSNELGEIELAEKVRGSSKVFNRLAEIIESANVNFSERIAVISHANAIEKALGLKEKLEKLRFKDIIIVETNGLSTSYVNDGGVIISF